MNNIGKFDGVYTLPNNTTLFRITKITPENRKSLKPLVPKKIANSFLSTPEFEGQYLLEGKGYKIIIEEDDFKRFTKMNKKDAANLLSGGGC